MSQIKTNDSTQRSQKVTLNASLDNTVQFYDTEPNHVFLLNYGAATLYLSMYGIASDKHYDMKIGPYEHGIYGQELGVKQCSIYVDGANPNPVQVVSYKATFNPAVLAGGGGSSGSGGGGGVASSVTINGFSAALPAGSNNIGKVVVTSMPAITVNQGAIPAGTANIGSVDVATLPALAAGASHIGSVNVDNPLNINSMPPVEVSQNPVRASHFSWEGVVAETAQTANIDPNATGVNIETINYLTNDGDTDLYISFDSVTVTTTLTNGNNGIIHLKPGDTIDNLNRQTSQINMLRASGSGNVRILGV